MQQIREKTKAQGGVQAAAAPQQTEPRAEARLAAVVQAAYILEARTR
jgi:hypothetical protein